MHVGECSPDVAESASGASGSMCAVALKERASMPSGSSLVGGVNEPSSVMMGEFRAVRIAIVCWWLESQILDKHRVGWLL